MDIKEELVDSLDIRTLAPLLSLGVWMRYNNKAYKWNSLVADLDPTQMIVKTLFAYTIYKYTYMLGLVFGIAVRSTEFAQKKNMQKKE